MKQYELKVNLYEIQVILYWTLGVLILNIGEWKFFGWLSIIYGWWVCIWTIRFVWGEVYKEHQETKALQDK